MRGSVQLPEFADAVALPAAHCGPNFLAWDRVGQVVGQRPAADLGAVEPEVVQAQGCGGGKAVGAGGRTTQPFAQAVQHGLRPGSGVVATGAARDPASAVLVGAGAAVGGGQRVAPAAGKVELVGGMRGRQGAVAEGFEHVADKRRCMAMGELLVVFKELEHTPHPSPRRDALRRPSGTSADEKPRGGD